MNRHRLLFSKTGRARYISHLDLIRTFQRAFMRAGVEVRHTEGFNPHPFISIALPLSVGFESECELMDFELKSPIPLEKLPQTLTAALPEGIAVTEAYEAARPFKELAFLRYAIDIVYDNGVPEDTVELLENLFARPQLIVEKRSKKSSGPFDITPHIKNLVIKNAGGEMLSIGAVLSARNTVLNPEYIVAAIKVHLPEASPDFARFKRIEALDDGGAVFR